MAGWALTPIAPAAAQLYILRAAAPDASAAPFIFTAATVGAGNSKILSDEILGSSQGMTQGLEILEFALGILELPTMSFSGLTRGSLC